MTSAAGERSFSSAQRLKTWLRSTMTQIRLSNLTILNTHKQRTDKLCLIDVANEFAALNENRKNNFGTFKQSDLKMSLCLKALQPGKVLNGIFAGQSEMFIEFPLKDLYKPFGDI